MSGSGQTRFQPGDIWGRMHDDLPDQLPDAAFFRALKNQKLRVLRARRGFEKLPLLLAEIHGDGQVDLANPAWSKSLGYRPEELGALSFRELLADEAHVPATLQSLLETPAAEAVEFALRCKDGGEKRFRWHRQFDPFTQSLYITGEEVTARSNEHQLRAQA